MTSYRKKVIEVALPLDAINRESAREKSLRHGHPSTLHLWWARRPLAACRAVLFAQLVDDPSAWPDCFPTDEHQDRERQRLFRIVEELVKWENSDNDRILEAARLEIARSVARSRVADGVGDNRDQEVLKNRPTPAVLRSYLAEIAPPVYDPFAGGGSIPLEAQRLGLRAIAADLNPVAVVINRALIEIPPKFAGRAPVGPPVKEPKQKRLPVKHWTGATGLAEDVRRYGAWMREEALRRIGHLYPEVELPPEYGGGRATVIAWLWARTVESPNPAFRGIHVPLVSNFYLSTKKGKETWVESVAESGGYRFEIRTGTPNDRARVKEGTKLGRGANFRCILSDTPIEPDYVKGEGKAGRMRTRLMAVVVEGDRRRIYLPATLEMEAIAASAEPEWIPDQELPDDPRNFWTVQYGLTTFGALFTHRQLVALNTFSKLVLEARAKASVDARAAGWEDDGLHLNDGGAGATAYGDALATYLALGTSRYANPSSTVCSWNPGKSKEDIRYTFARQALPMTWDFAEGNPFSSSSGNFADNLQLWIYKAVRLLPATPPGSVFQSDAAHAASAVSGVVSTDPPYYDNIAYADLSDFFYIWLRKSLQPVFPDVFGTMLVPKREELVAAPYRHGGREAAEAFFLNGMTDAVEKMATTTPDDTPLTLYYAFKQSEATEEGVSSTGWETFLDALLRAGLSVTGTWPMRTERHARSISIGTNALASSIVLVCRRRPDDSSTTTRGDFRRLLKEELPGALKVLQKGNIAPVDLAQASIGPGMAVFSRYKKVVEADGTAMSVRSALQLIYQISDEVRGEDEGEFDQDTRFAVTWFESHGFEEGLYGDAETLAKARAVSVSGVQEAGVLRSAAGKVRLYTRAELPEDWEPETDLRMTVWEATQHLIKRLNGEGEQAASTLLARLGATAEQARNLAYRLYTTCERKGWAEEAQVYNGLVVAWPELASLAGERGLADQAELFA